MAIIKNTLNQVEVYVKRNKNTITKYSSKFYNYYTKFLLLTIPLCIITYLFGSLIYLLMPAPGFSQNLYFDYSSKNLNYPISKVQIQNKYKELTAGVTYSMSVEITVPESEKNVNCGAVMLTAEFFNIPKETTEIHTKKYSEKDQKITETFQDLLIPSHLDSKIIPFKYSSNILKFFKISIFAPFYIFGFKTENQKLKMELFNDRNTEPLIFSKENLPNVLKFEISNKNFQIYDASVYVYGSSIYHFLTKGFFNFWPYFSTVLLAIPLVNLYIYFLTWSLKIIIVKYQNTWLEDNNTQNVEVLDDSAEVPETENNMRCENVENSVENKKKN